MKTLTPDLNPLRRLAAIETLNFALTNRVPRVALTRLMGWYSGLRSPALTRLSLAAWRLFTDINLEEAEPQRYESLQQVFTRRLRPGARTVDTDPAVLASPCDAIVGACGRVTHGMLFQAKGSSYRLDELMPGTLAAGRGIAPAERPVERSVYATLRLTSAMYHRFHAPHDLTVRRVTYVSGDAYNVNPAALARLPGLFCRNERAVLRATLARDGATIHLVPVAAILVASIRLHCIDVQLNLRHRGTHEWACEHAVRKGDEMGWFEHGSTIIMFAPPGYELAEGIAAGAPLRMGQALMRVSEHEKVPATRDGART